VEKETRDKRTQKTRQALLGAFFGLVLERRYDEIKVADILERARVGRSTFYEHFSRLHSREQPQRPVRSAGRFRATAG
jgi:AcrR family transcriptional regulator